MVYPESPEYESVRRPAWAQYENVRPVAVVRCRTPADVAGSLAVARRLDLEVAPRGGGHCFAGRSATGGLVIDLSPMSSVAESDGIATVGAGARLGEIDERLATDALAIPAGSCPAVGIAGLTLGGGLGILGRTYGLTSDQLVDAQVVLADGRVVECDERREEVVLGVARRRCGPVRRRHQLLVQSRTRTGRPLPARLAAGQGRRPTRVWQSWAPSAPDELAASLLLNVPADPERPPTATLFGSSLGAKDATERLLEELVVGAGEDPTSRRSSTSSTYGPSAISGSTLPAPSRMEKGLAGGEPRPVLAFAKSEFFRRGLPREPIDALVDHLGARRALGQARELDFTPWEWGLHPTRSGGDRTHRRERFLLKHAVNIPSDASPGSKTLPASGSRDRGGSSIPGAQAACFPTSPTRN